MRGFTLTETIIVVALYTLLITVIMASVTQLYQHNSYTLEQANEVEVARKGVSTWMRDVREMTHAATGAYPVARLESHRMGFYSDIDKDNGIEYVEYVLASSTLYKYTYEATGTPAVYSTSTPSRTDILSEYVQNLNQSQVTFAYYNDSGNVLVSPQAMLSDMRYATIQIIVNIDPVRSPGEFMLRGSATPRNLKENL